jgi:tetratricopeptide (TPR) repeat protein
MEKKEALRNYNQLKEKFKTLEEERLDKDAQIEINRRQIKEFQKQAEEAMIKNRELEKRAQEIPARFAEMARENKVLIKETALMHYNLGVFYTKNKEYSRATAEFEKATELNPEDPYAHYNLGYIYAEYLVDRSKSIEHFRKFLSLCKTDDKDVDWVRKYILTWQTWGGKKPIQ